MRERFFRCGEKVMRRGWKGFIFNYKLFLIKRIEGVVGRFFLCRGIFCSLDVFRSRFGFIVLEGN